MVGVSADRPRRTWRGLTWDLKALGPSSGLAGMVLCAFVLAGAVSGEGTDVGADGGRMKRMVQTNVRGLHVCRSQGGYICCPGWKPNPGSGLCLTPVCRGSCGEGVCSAPNTCTRCQQTPYGTTTCQRTAPAYSRSSYPVHPYSQTQYAALNRQTSQLVSAPHYVQGYQTSNSPRYQTHAMQGYQTRPSYSTSGGRSCSTLGCRYGCGSTATGSTSCTCPPGYMLASDRRSCRDVDECSRYSGLCQQNCRNTLGGYQCSCTTGHLMNNRRTCSDSRGCTTCRGGMPAPGPVTLPGSGSCPAGFQPQRTSQGIRCVDIDECRSSQCDQECINTEGGMRCECGPGFTLSPDGQGCTDIDECARSDWQPCHHTCINSRGSFRCSCQPGYYLHQNGRSCLDVNECTQGGGQVCHHICQNTHGSYRCSCRPGFELQSDGTTCRDIDECSQGSNGCSGSCINTIGSYQCSCTQGYTNRGGTCVDIDECQMSNGGCEQLCVNTQGSFLCSCRQGYTLNSDARTCTDVDECGQFSGRVCEHGCENVDGTYQCRCPSGFRLHANKQNCIDINECVEQQGVCHYRCVNTRGSYHCICPPSFQLAADGRMCDDVDECTVSNHGCQGGCENTMGSYHCTCAEGQLGTGDLYCGKQPSGCTSDMCSHKCVDTGVGHQCMCPRGYQLHSGGRHCEDKNECLEVGKGGCQHQCTNTMGSYYCSCYPGYRLHYDRKHCVPSPGCNTCNVCPAGFRMNTQTRRCEDVDECSSPPNHCGTTRCSPNRAVCSHNCINTVGSYSCTCRPGYLIQPDGYTCAQDGPVCSPPCRNGGTCRYSRQCGGNTYNCRFTECTCRAGFTGPHCENVLPTSCQPPCMNGGQCVDGICQCTAGFTGPSCSSDKNECLNHRCEHHCQNTFGSFQCLCRGGYTINADGETCSEIGCFPPCMNGATCVNKACVCPEGFSGPNCQTDINECATDNGGCEYICRNTYGSYVCFCPRGATLSPDKHSCSGVTCSPPCNNNGTCVNRMCRCPPGFTGPTCLQDINECNTDNPCAYQCLNTYGSYECVCPDGTQLGDDRRSCEDLFDCIPPCQNGGTCRSGTCICPEGFTGPTCTTDIDECQDPTRCTFQCNNYYGGYQCLCPLGFMLGEDGRKCVVKNECPQSN
ncbi:fibrillin-1-like [Acanthaster planci]|uniref:Fibrillin-1-like n=1 Tax=Acanthaster planci TaxID=133434 RepID=A0A8B7YVZ9_ACAPL|nr:fibrillin-1-like [Acanthaster planci]